MPADRSTTPRYSPPSRSRSPLASLNLNASSNSRAVRQRSTPYDTSQRSSSEGKSGRSSTGHEDDMIANGLKAARVLGPTLKGIKAAGRRGEAAELARQRAEVERNGSPRSRAVINALSDSTIGKMISTTIDVGRGIEYALDKQKGRMSTMQKPPKEPIEQIEEEEEEMDGAEYPRRRSDRNHSNPDLMFETDNDPIGEQDALDLDVEFGDTNPSNDDDDDSVHPSHQSSPPTSPASVHEHSGGKSKTIHKRAKTRISSTSSTSAGKGKQKAVLRSEMTAEEAQAKREYQSARAAIRKQEKDAIKNDHALLLKRVYDVYVIISSLKGTKVDGNTIYRMIDLKLKEWKPEEINGELATGVIKSKKARKVAKKAVAPKKKGRISTAASPAPVRRGNRARSDYASTEDDDDDSDDE